MFKKEIDVLHDMIKNSVPEDKSELLLLKMTTLKNISKTMGGLIKNIVGEIDHTREQMFLLLESYAALEIEKDPRQFQKDKVQATKGPQLPIDTAAFEEEKVRLSNESVNYDNEEPFPIEEEEEIFQDAQEEFIPSSQQLVSKTKTFLQDVFEERMSLPALRDPNLKFGVWQVLKDLIGKDLTRVSMPVYFNEPLSLN